MEIKEIRGIEGLEEKGRTRFPRLRSE